MKCNPNVYCQPGAAETIWRALDLVCVVCALTLPIVAFRRWGGSQRNAGAILAVDRVGIAYIGGSVGPGFPLRGAIERLKSTGTCGEGEYARQCRTFTQGAVRYITDVNTRSAAYSGRQ